MTLDQFLILWCVLELGYGVIAITLHTLGLHPSPGVKGFMRKHTEMFQILWWFVAMSISIYIVITTMSFVEKFW